jgi:hypothetical protein
MLFVQEQLMLVATTWNSTSLSGSLSGSGSSATRRKSLLAIRNASVVLFEYENEYEHD